MLNKDKMC